MSNFDLRKFLAEGKLYEEATSTEEAMKPSNKMKMSELKKKIRQEILAELTLTEDDDIDFGIGGEETQADVDFYEGLEEATKDGDGEVPAKDKDTDIDIVDKEEVEVDVEEKPKATGANGDFLDQLEDLKDEADAMGDNKLERQVDNTITYFTRQHIAKDTNESIELEEADRDYYDAAERDDAAHIAALERDMEDDKRSALKEAQEDEVPLTSKVKSFINKAISDAKKDGEFENLKKADWFENELIDMLIELFKDKDYDRASKEVKDYIKTKTTIKESLEILRMKKLAGLLKEGEYAKALLRENIEQEGTDFALLIKYVDELSKQVVRPDLYKSNFNIWEIALFYEYDEAVNKGFIKADEISKEEFNNLHNKLNDNYDFNYFVRNWTVLDDEESRHEEDMNKDLEYFKTSYNVDDETADIMKKVVDKFLNI